MMTKLIAAAALLLATGATATAEKKEEPQDVCQSIASFAEQLMKNRQMGVPLGQSLTLADKTENAAAAATIREIIILAYDRPHYSTEEIQQKTIGDFRDNVHLECLKAMKKP